jgi:hypothetical protein
MVNDQISEVDGKSLSGITNQEAVEILKHTGPVVKLTIVRYLRGLKFEELQDGIKAANAATPTSPYPQTPATPSDNKLLPGLGAAATYTQPSLVSIPFMKLIASTSLLILSGGLERMNALPPFVYFTPKTTTIHSWWSCTTIWPQYCIGKPTISNSFCARGYFSFKKAIFGPRIISIRFK